MNWLLVTDAWSPQTNGVVTTLRNVCDRLAARGLDTVVVHPGLFRAAPLPGYPEVRVAIDPWRIGPMIDALQPDAVHIATEGPLGFAARRHLVRRGVAFSTSLHTKFPEYVAARTRLPASLGYAYLRWFHRTSTSTLVTTASHARELGAFGFDHLVVWGRGVDTERFAPPRRRGTRDRTHLLYVGRVAVEKNLAAFLALDIDADKTVVGDGPARTELQARYPDATWAGYRYGDELARFYGDADAFVFPSRTDTFGLVMLEAMACGTPVAAYPVTGPCDVVVDGVNGALDGDLARAVQRALSVDRTRCREFALAHGWDRIAQRIAEQVTTIDWRDPRRVGAPIAAYLRTPPSEHVGARRPTHG